MRSFSRDRSVTHQRLKPGTVRRILSYAAPYRRELAFFLVIVAMDAGITVAGSSDRPVASGAPLQAMQFMVERRTSGGLPVGPGEAITAAEALAAYTIGSAYACRVEDELGSLSPGKQADLVVIKGDPSKKIEDIENVETVFKDGIGYDSAKLMEACRGTVGSR